jgi:YVTN family beta-propeller protein
MLTDMLKLTPWILMAGAALFAQEQPGVITTNQKITPAGAQSVFHGRVYGVAFGAGPSEVWALGVSEVTRLDWQANRVIEKITFDGVAGLQGIRYDPAAKRVLFTGSRKDARQRNPERAVALFSAADGKSAPLGVDLAGVLAGAPAIGAKGAVAIVPLTAANSIAVVNTQGEPKERSIAVGKVPFGAVVNALGTAAYVSNWGGRLPRNGDLTATTGAKSGSDPIVVDARGIASTGAVSRVDVEAGKVTHTIAVGLHPTGMVWNEAANLLYVANGNEDSVSVIDTRQQRVVRTISIQPFARKAAGIAPTALELSPDGATLYVACGGINAVAVVDARTGTIRGLLPTAWYPNAVAVSGDGKYLAVSTLLGIGSGWRDEPKRKAVQAIRGTVHVIALPEAAELANFTTSVARNNHMLPGGTTETVAAGPKAVPARAGDPSPIQHVVYIVKENRTFDQVFGDIGKGEVDPSLVMYGERVTPNQHRLAREFVLLDNFYATGGNSGDGHQWLTQANETDYCMWPGYVGRSYPFDGTDPVAYSKNGFLWDLALRAGKTVRIFGEYAGSQRGNLDRLKLLEAWKAGEDFTARWKTEALLKPLNKILAVNYPAYTTAVPDVIRAQIFLKEFAAWEREGKMPNLTIVQLPSNHTRGTAPGTSSPAAMVADNDLALGRIVEALSKSRFWKKMAIFVVEDDAQNGVDHVDGHRTVALAISPYARRGAVDSTMYSHPSMVKTIELILGLPTMSIFDLIANPMSASFQEQADERGFVAQVPEQSLYEVNPSLAGLRGPARKAAADSARMRFDIPDAAPTQKLNRILWSAARGWETPYPGSRRAAFVPPSLDLDDDDR